MALAASLHSISSTAVALSPLGFVDLDDRLATLQPGLVLVRTTAEAQSAVVAHAVRRLRASSGMLPAYALAAPMFREVATQLRVGTLPSDPAQAADTLAAAAREARSTIVLPVPARGSWDHAVATELARSPSVLLVLVGTAEAVRGLASSELVSASFEVSSALTPADKLRWLGAVAEDAQHDLPAGDLPGLEAWWSNARRASAEPAAPTDLGPVALRALVAVALTARSVPADRVMQLAGAEGLTTLASRGLLVVRGSLVAAAVTAEDACAAASAEDISAAIALLAEGPGFEPDPWAYARVAELQLRLGAHEAADAAITRASRGLDHPEAAQDLWSRWTLAVRDVDGERGLWLRLRAAERALTMGEALLAQRWCDSAAQIAEGDPAIALTSGRALLQLGDLVAARVALKKAEATAAQRGDDELLARAYAELAEVAYLAGDHATATQHAEKAIARASTPVTRLAGRNTLGKLLLAASQWDAADEHFASDAMAASAARETNAELRARLNRAIALMSNGSLDDARTALERVLADAEATGADRARAHALGNLAVIAYRRHEYGTALALWEQTVRFPQALRGRIATARTVANLAELRLRLGLVEHADHAVTFGRRLLGTGTTAARASHFGVVAARIALARGQTDLARREVEAALIDGEIAGDRDYLGEAHRLAARVALDDGDLVRAELSLARGDELATNDRARAEVAILRALLLRASGGVARDSAERALVLARSAGEEDLLGEIHVLLASLARDAGDLAVAEHHVARAVAMRDQVASGLPDDVRAAFLAKAEIVQIGRLRETLAQDDDVDAAPRTARTPVLPSTAEVDAARAPREIVGDDPQIRSLLAAIRKVARSNSTVLVRGESGTGKELVAEALHRASERASGPLVSLNCAALVETLLLSELFGHEKGAFTGATARRRGRFELAEGGTLFLDEIGDISPRTQVALLRVLQERTFERVGGTQPIRANVRVVCATHRDLRAMVERGEFREDLYYRLRGITLEVPALRNRLGDLGKIASHLLVRIAKERNESPKRLSAEALSLLARHRWPGNVRELENVLRAASLFAEGEVIGETDLIDNVDDLRALAQAAPMSQGPLTLRPPPSLAAVPPSSPSTATSFVGDDDESGELPVDEANATQVAYAQVRQGAVSLSDMKRQIERDCIARALMETKGNITRAAAILGMKRPRLSQLVKQYGLAVSVENGQ